ncbi:prephenate dehydratase [Antrihabitans cavernicola]|uniref:Prephenate dehydratase n=1 Tax=Antrihabitans cavernicola TaxID=2495913 RepID=A0A5A7SJ96_9NOCA|nr:prephenate dehydratase [Spelaeibacter cavernicola]KAA0024703.1 prephenate dehydratase [Spelaeibacter cavernicola]
MQRIAYFGPSGTFTEMALAGLETAGAFDGTVERVTAASQPAALELVRAGDVDGAVVPIESSIEGSIPATLDSLAMSARLQIVAEIDLDVSFSIVAKSGTALTDVRTICAYPVAAAQVRLWLERELPDVEVRYAASNAAAAEDVANGLADAAVSTALAGERLGLESLASGVVDYEGARTRFVHVTKPRRAPAVTGSDRTSIVLELPNEPGSLFGAFAEFATRGIDLTRIESRPTRTGIGTYRFYLDCIGHIDDAAVGEALKALHRMAASVRFLGSWPAANEFGTAPPSDAPDSQWLAELREGRADL